ncbi:hypothetical protein [Nonomuraea sp. NPDC050202]|uniref:hypothetical protein n=1 Tax=Nonomuraea sp. NPDC050202 TaxID=3155035 RepID=UPI0034119809
MDAILVTAVSAITSLAVSLITLYVGGLQRRRDIERARQAEIQRGYLNPLRFHTSEVHHRLDEILRAVEADDDDRRRALDAVETPADVSTKPAEWLTGHGCYLTSTVYLTVCLFCWIERVRREIPYLRLQGKDDTVLTGLLLQVQRAFLKDLGVYYVLQTSIGEDMWFQDEGRLYTYREFCQRLSDPDTRIWFDRAFLYFLETARNQKIDRVSEAVEATRVLGSFLDNVVAGGSSLNRSQNHALA